jgi:hexosaminidase
MAFPRLLATADVAWGGRRDWEAFRSRVAAEGGALDRLGVAYFRSPEIAWG